MHYAKSLRNTTLLEQWCNMSVVQFSSWAHGGDRPKQALQQHFTPEVNLGAIQRLPVRHFQSKYHKALISEYCTITYVKPLVTTTKCSLQFFRGMGSGR